MLHYDIIRKISLYLPPLSLILNKESRDMYTESWYQDHLELQYPNRNMYVSTTYYDLYCKSLKTGIVHIIDWREIGDSRPLECNGVKRSLIGGEMRGHTILTFNGDLFLEDYTSVTLIDTNIIDISENTYIKDVGEFTEWYVYTNKWEKVDINAKFTQVEYCYDNNIAYALTSDGVHIYHVRHKHLNFIVVENTVTMCFDLNCHVMNNKKEVFKITMDINSNDIISQEPVGPIIRNNGKLFWSNKYCYQDRQYNYKYIDPNVEDFIIVGDKVGALTRDKNLTFNRPYTHVHHNVKKLGPRSYPYFIQ